MQIIHQEQYLQFSYGYISFVPHTQPSFVLFQNIYILLPSRLFLIHLYLHIFSYYMLYKEDCRNDHISLNQQVIVNLL
jgi:hypothetical protein